MRERKKARNKYRIKINNEIKEEKKTFPEIDLILYFSIFHFHLCIFCFLSTFIVGK